MEKLRLLLILEICVIVFATNSTSCTRKVFLARAEQADMNGLRCWDDKVKVAACGGRCESWEIPDWQFPFKLSNHSVCGFSSRRPLMVRLRHCDPGVTPGTELFHYISAGDCRCKVCSSQHTSCEWLPPNSALLKDVTQSGDIKD